MPAPPKTMPLDKFLADLPAEAAEKIREVAITMMHNEQVAVRLRGVELELRPYFITAALAFIAGMVMLLFHSHPGGMVDRIDGGWPLLLAAVGFLPALLGYYAVRIRKRSQADLRNFDLNKEFFLPHGAIYFPSDSGPSEQMVTLVEVQETQPGRRSKWDNVKPGAIW